MTEIEKMRLKMNSLINNFKDESETNNKSEIKLCHHYHRELMSVEQLRENEYVSEEITSHQTFYEFPSYTELEIGLSVKKSDLIEISDSECMCTVCKQKFPIDKISQMTKLFDRINVLNDKGIPNDAYLSDLELLKLHEGLEPVRYSIESDGDVSIYGTEYNPRKWEIYSHPYLQPKDYIEKLPVCQLPEFKDLGGYNRYVCKHYRGDPNLILLHRTNDPMPKIAGKTESLLFTNPYGVCKCSECRKVFSLEEQLKIDKLIDYLNTPHYLDEKTKQFHTEWEKVLEFYDQGYNLENDPYDVIKTERILELSGEIEPIIYSKERKKETKILSKLKWKDNKWSRD